MRGALGVAVALLGWLAWLAWLVQHEFEGRQWSVPARVYAEPGELYAGLDMSADRMVRVLTELGYRPADGVTVRPGTWWRQGDTLRVLTRPFRFWDGPADATMAQLDFRGGRLARLRDADGRDLPLLRLDPLQIGSIFPVHGEDRVVLSPEEIPPLLADALIAVEDRRFFDHAGVDPVAIARALVVNVRAGGIRQGGSTLTQQLVKSMFLDSRRTFGRKITEAAMAVILDARYDKDEILTAYVNEIYLGQDGRRAVHGFGLASHFYFARPLRELDAHEIALLVAVVRGPSWYNPWRHPDRARDRRDRVLAAMVEQGAIPPGPGQQAAARPLGVVQAGQRSVPGYPAYVDLVRRQLRRDYRESDLTSSGLTVFTSFEPAAQRRAQAALQAEIERLEGERELDGLEGAVVMTRHQTGEVVALVGGRRADFAGFNRALDAHRPVGSLIKPVVFLSALSTGRYHLGTMVDDVPVELTLENGDVWRPGNFRGEGEGPVPLVRALADSLNLATVNVGLDVGVETVADMALQLGLPRRPAAYPSLLLGAVDLSPLEAAALYNTLASGGFRAPLRAVREVMDAEGKPLARYPLSVEAPVDGRLVRQVNDGLVQVMERGTGRRAAGRLDGRRVAGKTGTSDGFRDSWFAGFDGDNLAVVWMGYDDNRPTGLSGASGALGVWARLMRTGAALDSSVPEGLHRVWLDYASGRLASRGCGDPVAVTLPESAEVAVMPGCRVSLRGLATRTREWLKDRLQ